MRFNDVDHKKRMTDLTKSILDGADQSWRGTVELRYSQFLLRQAANLLTGAAVDLPRAHSGSERQQAAAAARGHVANAQTQIAMASALVAGHVALRKPANTEAMLRLHEEARHPYDLAGVPVAFKCKAQLSAADPPQDCDWPVCGCDAYAEKVLAWIEQQGLVIDRHQEMIDKAALKAGDLD